MSHRASPGAATRARRQGSAALKPAKSRDALTAVKNTKTSPRRSAAPTSKQAAPLVAGFFDSAGKVIVKRVADDFGMSKGQLAETVGLHPEALYKSSRTYAPKTQSRVREMLEIVSRISDWAGGKDQAMAWYRAEPISAFGGRTAESIVKTGQAGALRDYLDTLAMGGFA